MSRRGRPLHRDLTIRDRVTPSADEVYHGAGAMMLPTHQARRVLIRDRVRQHLSRPCTVSDLRELLLILLDEDVV